jgi:hypothetical protein
MKPSSRYGSQPAVAGSNGTMGLALAGGGTGGSVFGIGTTHVKKPAADATGVRLLASRHGGFYGHCAVVGLY